MVINYILFGLGALSIGLGIVGIVKHDYDKKKEDMYTKESVLKCGLVSNITNICTGVGVILCGLSYNAMILPAQPWTYIFLVFVVLVLLADSIIEPKILVKKEETK